MFLSSLNYSPINDRLNNVFTNRWIGRRPCDPPRLLDISNAPYGIHRKLINQELLRPIPVRIDPPIQVKMRSPRDMSKDSAKIRNSTTDFNSNSQMSRLNIQSRNNRRPDDLSQHITIKSQPIHPSNVFSHNSNSTLTSWQKYWISTHSERRRLVPFFDYEVCSRFFRKFRKGLHVSEPIFYCPKLSPSPAQTKMNDSIVRSSPRSCSGYHSDSRTPSTTPSSCDPSKLSAENPIDQQVMSTEEDLGIGELSDEQQDHSDEISFTVPEIDSSAMVSSKLTIHIPFAVSDEDEDKLVREKSFVYSSMSSRLKSDSQLINEVANAQPITQTVQPKLFEMTPPPQKKKVKKIQVKSRSRSKSKEKKSQRSPSPPKRRRQKSGIRDAFITNQSLSTRKKTIIPFKSKSIEKKWDEPYIGSRDDPPPPPSSPSYLLWPDSSDYNEDDSYLEMSRIPNTLPDDLHVKSYEFYKINLS